MTAQVTANETPHVVIIGAGFGGMEAARKLANAPVRITMINRENYHLFQPLLYQVAIAGLVPSQIAHPVRTIFRNQKNFTFQMGEVSAIDFDARFVRMNGSVIGYDYLILAVAGRRTFTIFIRSRRTRSSSRTLTVRWRRATTCSRCSSAPVVKQMWISAARC